MDEVIIDDPDIIINNFNYFFTNVGTKLAQTHKETDFNTISKFLSKRLIHLCMYLNPPSPTKVFNVINVLGSKKTIGCDHIPSEFTKFSANVIAQYLHYYFNFAFNFGAFSDSRKIDKKGI